MLNAIRRFLIKYDPFLKPAQVSENLFVPISDEQKQANLEWLESLLPNTIIIDFDENGEPTNLDQIDQLRVAIESEVQKIKGSRNAND